MGPKNPSVQKLNQHDHSDTAPGTIADSSTTPVPQTLPNMVDEITCGRPTKSGKLRCWDAGRCPVHSACEAADMAREDRLSRAVEKGLCGTPTAGGGRCDRIRGDCPYHAAGEARCSSCLDGAPDRQCSVRKRPGSDQALDLPARTLRKLLPTPGLCETIRWMAASAHPTAKLIKRLQFTRETKDWEDRAGVTEISISQGRT